MTDVYQPAVNVPYASTVENGQPQLYWRLDDQSNTAADSSGNGNTGTYSGSTYTQGSAGALSANGDNDAATAFNGGGVASTGTFNDAKVTVEAWVYLKSLPSAGDALIAGFDQGGGVTDKTLYVDSSGHLYWYVYDGAQKTITGPTLSLNQWIHVVGTDDGTTSCLYVNGSLVGSTAAGSSYASYTSPNFHVGWSPNFYAIDAVIDEVAVYDHALSASQISAQYNAAIGNTARPHWHYVYDADGNMTSETDPNGNTTSFTYDELDRQLTRTLPALGTTTVTETTTYDALGREATHVDFNGNTAVYSYYTSGIHLGMVSEIDYYKSTNPPGPSATPDETVTYAYDSLVRKSQVVDSTDATTTYAYDALGNLASVTRSSGGVTLSAIHYVYDTTTGRLIETWTGTGADDTTSTTETLYGYDQKGDLASVTTARENGAAVSLTSSTTTREDTDGNSISTTLPTTLYLYDGQGRLIHQINPNNTETDYDYTHYWDVGGGEEIVTNNRTSDSTTLSKFTYSFDADRNKISELDQMTDAGEGASNAQLYTWAYDADGRLTDETFDNQYDGGGGTNAVTADDYHDHYDYDLNGNRIDEKIDAKNDGGSGTTAVYDQITNYLYNSRNELTSEMQFTVSTGATVYTTGYLYDPNGSLKQSTRTDSNGSAITTYTYDARNRILTVASGGSTTTYTYNDDGILVQQATAGGNTTTYLIDANNPTGYSQVLEVRANGTLAITYTLGSAIIAQNANGAISYLMPDGHGSTRQLTAFTNDSSNGHVTARYDYDAYGDPVTLTATTHATNSASTSVLYTGMLTDPVTGNYRTETREYTAIDGRFLWQDSYMPAAGDSANANLYVYDDANPTNAADPTGMYTQKFGYAVEAAVQSQYSQTHPKDIPWILYGVPTTLGKNPALKPDIFNMAPGAKKWMEIKPLSVGGVIGGFKQRRAYIRNFAPIGYSADTRWVPPTQPLAVMGEDVYVFNVGGILFYTNFSPKDLAVVSFLVVYAGGLARSVAQQAIVNFEKAEIARLEYDAASKLKKISGLLETEEDDELAVAIEDNSLAPVE